MDLLERAGVATVLVGVGLERSLDSFDVGIEVGSCEVDVAVGDGSGLNRMRTLVVGRSS